MKHCGYTWGFCLCEDVCPLVGVAPVLLRHLMGLGPQAKNCEHRAISLKEGMWRKFGAGDERYKRLGPHADPSKPKPRAVKRPRRPVYLGQDQLI